MIVLLAVTALLCGVPIGIVIGLIMARVALDAKRVEPGTLPEDWGV